MAFSSLHSLPHWTGSGGEIKQRWCDDIKMSQRRAKHAAWFLALMGLLSSSVDLPKYLLLRKTLMILQVTRKQVKKEVGNRGIISSTHSAFPAGLTEHHLHEGCAAEPPPPLK